MKRGSKVICIRVCYVNGIKAAFTVGKVYSVVNIIIDKMGNYKDVLLYGDDFKFYWIEVFNAKSFEQFVTVEEYRKRIIDGILE